MQEIYSISCCCILLFSCVNKDDDVDSCPKEFFSDAILLNEVNIEKINITKTIFEVIAFAFLFMLYLLNGNISHD